MKFFVKSLVMAAATIAVTMSASATTLDNVLGPVEFKYSGATTESGTQAGTNETTWGIGNVTSITRPSGPPDFGANLWTSGTDGQFLTYMLYGIADLSIVPGGVRGFEIFNVGATGAGCGTRCGSIYLDVWLRGAAGSGVAPSGRSGYSNYNGVTDAGTLYLRLEFVKGIVVDDVTTIVDESLATLFQDVSSATLPATGSGSFYANAVDGIAKSKFASQGFTTLAGTRADFFGRFDLTGVNSCAIGSDCFGGLTRDPLLGTAMRIPEPGSLALVGLAMLGLGAVRRFKA